MAKIDYEKLRKFADDVKEKALEYAVDGTDSIVPTVIDKTTTNLVLRKFYEGYMTSGNIALKRKGTKIRYTWCCSARERSKECRIKLHLGDEEVCFGETDAGWGNVAPSIKYLSDFLAQLAIFTDQWNKDA